MINVMNCIFCGKPRIENIATDEDKTQGNEFIPGKIAWTSVIGIIHQNDLAQIRDGVIPLPGITVTVCPGCRNTKTIGELYFKATTLKQTEFKETAKALEKELKDL